MANTLQNLERKMYENPKIALSFIVIFLLIFGFLAGMGYTVNLYNSDHDAIIQMIQNSAQTRIPIEINNEMYSISKLNISKNGTFISEIIP